MQNLVIYVRHAESESNAIIHTAKKENLIHTSKKSNLKILSQSQEVLLNSYSDPNITFIGSQQASCLAEHLINKINILNKKTVNIWISPFKRTIETANKFIELCTKNNIDHNVKIMPELQEYTSKKKTLTDKEIDAGLIIHDTIDVFLNKITIFNDILKQHLYEQEVNQDSVLILFGHSLFFSSLMTYHITQETILPTDTSSLQIPNCSISCESFNCETNKWKTFIVGSIAHLPTTLITGNHVPFG